MRELTADTIIRVRRPLPLPRKRELTGETKIRLSQIKGLREWIEDQKYEIGQISTRTGLLKTAEGWVVPPHSMVPGNQDPIEVTHKAGGGGAGGSTEETPERKETHKTFHSFNKHELKEHLTPKKPLFFSKEQLKKILNFKAVKAKRTVDGKTVEVPAAFVQDPYKQHFTDTEYQKITQDLPEQINFLHFFDFNGKTLNEASDSLKLMGFVNACAFKGRSKEKLSPKEKTVNDVIYGQVKDVYVPRAVDFFMRNNARVRYALDDSIVFITNPFTKVQISFHEYYPTKGQNIELADEKEWNGVSHSYIYNNPEEMEKFEKMRARIKDTIKDTKELIDTENQFIINEPRGNKSMYEVLYEDGELVERNYKDDEEAKKYFQKNKEHGPIKIVKITNRKTNKEIKL